ncbi:MAG TPA: response regulator [Dehalococcoidia bacterium]|nr:response regulator [Dehalococcoidia bacterium]
MRIVGKKLLIVEDDQDLQRILIDVLTLEGALPVAASDGAIALSLASSQDFDLVVLDLNLPDMTGWDVLRGLQASQPGIAVVILTASADEASRQRALAAGVVDYVFKPVAIRELVSLLQRRLGPDQES